MFAKSAFLIREPTGSETGFTSRSWAWHTAQTADGREHEDIMLPVCGYALVHQLLRCLVDVIQSTKSYCNRWQEIGSSAVVRVTATYQQSETTYSTVCSLSLTLSVCVSVFCVVNRSVVYHSKHQGQTSAFCTRTHTRRHTRTDTD